MELKEAIMYLKNITDKDLSKLGYVYGTEAIETILKALENSIPKQKIKDKIEEYKNLIDDISESEQYNHEIPLYKHDIQVLQELFEDK